MYNELIEDSLTVAEMFYNGELTEDELYSLLYQGVIDEESLSEAFDYIEEGRNQNKPGYMMYDMFSGNRTDYLNNTDNSRFNDKISLKRTMDNMNYRTKDRILKGALKNANDADLSQSASRLRRQYIDGVRSGASKEELKNKLDQYKNTLRQKGSGISSYKATPYGWGSNDFDVEYKVNPNDNARKKFFKKY